MEEKNSYSKGLGRVIGASLLVLLLSSPLASAQDPPETVQEDCLFYAYTVSERHRFMLADNVSVFGTEVNLIHNCEEITIRLDGEFYLNTKNNATFTIEPGIYNMTVEAENQSIEWGQISFYPDRLNWEFEWELLNEEPSSFIDAATADIQINWAVSFSIVIVWVLSVYVYWSLINSYTQRNFIEEVVQ